MQYRLLCCADTHGRLPPPLPEEGAAAWLHAGDVTHGPTAGNGTPARVVEPHLAEIGRWFNSRALPVFAVRGNHDTVDPCGAFKSGRDVTGLVLRVAPRLFVAGLGWHGEKYFELPLEADLQKVADSVRRQALRTLRRDDRLVLLTHYPALIPGMYQVRGDAGVWYHAVRALVEDLRPVAVVQGHMHEWAWTSRQVNVGDREVLLFHPGRQEAFLTIDVDAGSAEVQWAVG